MTSEEIESLPLPEEQKKKVRKTHYFYIVSIGVIVIAAIMLVLGIYWLSYPVDAVTFANDDSKLPVKEESVKRGQYVTVVFDYCKNVKVDGLVKLSLVSKQVEIALPRYIDKTAKGCGHIEAGFRIPDDGSVIVPDNYKICFNVDYAATPIRRLVVDRFCTIEFYVPE